MSAKSELIYNNLPQVYRTMDSTLILKRFIEVLCEYGIDLVQQDIDKLSDSYNIDKMDLATLKHFASNFGYEYLNNVSEDYQRRLIKHLPYLYSIRGPIPCLNYIANDLTGYDCTIEETYLGDPNVVCVTLAGMEDAPLTTIQTKSTLGAFLPYYLDIVLRILYHFNTNISIESIVEEQVHFTVKEGMPTPILNGVYYMNGSILLNAEDIIPFTIIQTVSINGIID